MVNTDIQKEIKTAKVKKWQIADQLGMAESTFSRKLRYELSSDEKEKIRAIIKEMKGV